MLERFLADRHNQLVYGNQNPVDGNCQGFWFKATKNEKDICRWQAIKNKQPVAKPKNDLPEWMDFEAFYNTLIGTVRAYL